VAVRLGPFFPFYGKQHPLSLRFHSTSFPATQSIHKPLQGPFPRLFSPMADLSFLGWSNLPFLSSRPVLAKHFGCQVSFFWVRAPFPHLRRSPSRCSGLAFLFPFFRTFIGTVPFSSDRSFFLRPPLLIFRLALETGDIVLFFLVGDSLFSREEAL